MELRLVKVNHTDDDVQLFKEDGKNGKNENERHVPSTNTGVYPIESN